MKKRYSATITVAVEADNTEDAKFIAQAIVNVINDDGKRDDFELFTVIEDESDVIPL